MQIGERRKVGRQIFQKEWTTDKPYSEKNSVIGIKENEKKREKGKKGRKTQERSER